MQPGSSLSLLEIVGLQTPESRYTAPRPPRTPHRNPEEPLRGPPTLPPLGIPHCSKTLVA
eukprot:1372488-Alexandrium_andersonii.AAC.1